MSDNSTNNKRIAKNTFFLTIRMIFVTLVYIYTSRVILNALGVVDYGIYNVIGGFVSMFGFLNLSLANGIQRFYNYELGAKGTGAITPVYNAALIIQGVLALVILLLLESVGLWYLCRKIPYCFLAVSILCINIIINYYSDTVSSCNNVIRENGFLCNC